MVRSEEDVQENLRWLWRSVSQGYVIEDWIKDEFCMKKDSKGEVVIIKDSFKGNVRKNII